MLRADPSVLRLPGQVLQERLLLLRLLQQHAGLLRHVLVSDRTSVRLKKGGPNLPVRTAFFISET
jgi:hypothetical protein